MKPGDVAILVIIFLGVGLIAMLAMPMFDKIPTPDDPDKNETVQKVAIPIAGAFGQGLSALDIGLGIIAIIGAMIAVYLVVWRK